MPMEACPKGHQLVTDYYSKLLKEIQKELNRLLAEARQRKIAETLDA